MWRYPQAVSVIESRIHIDVTTLGHVLKAVFDFFRHPTLLLSTKQSVWGGSERSNAGFVEGSRTRQFRPGHRPGWPGSRILPNEPVHGNQDISKATERISKFLDVLESWMSPLSDELLSFLTFYTKNVRLKKKVFFPQKSSFGGSELRIPLSRVCRRVSWNTMYQ